jgi:predicted dehydrogenase
MKKIRTRINRRTFLSSSAAAMAGPLILRSAVLGREGQTPPSERIRVGFIGTGKMMHDYHLPSMLGFEDAEAVAVCDVDVNRRLHAKKVVEDRYRDKRPYKGCDVYHDYREMLDRKDIDAVIISTPDHAHALPVLHACLAGKDLYCEKPLAHTLREAELCIKAARKHGRVLQTGSQQRSGVFGQFPLGCELIQNGRLGKIQRVWVGVGGPAVPCTLPEEPMEGGLDWNMWLGPAPLRPYHSALSPRGMHNHFPAWRSYREYAGGGLSDMGAHHFDIAQWALGMDESGPVKIIPPEGRNATSGARFIYANGIEMIHGGPGGCVFEGERGRLRIDRGVLSSDPEELVKEPLGENAIRLPRSPGHHRDWMNAIRSRSKPICDVEVGARSAAICILGNLAYWHGQTLEWNPRTWTFADAIQNEWLDKPRREGWGLPRI